MKYKILQKLTYKLRMQKKNENNTYMFIEKIGGVFFIIVKECNVIVAKDI